MTLGKSGEQRADFGEVTGPADDESRECIAVDGDALCLHECFAHQSPSPQCQPTGNSRIVLDGCAHVFHSERCMTGVCENVEDDRLRLLVIDKPDYLPV